MSAPETILEGAGLQFLSAAAEAVSALAEREGEAIATVGGRIAASVAGGGIVHLFGSGHSRLAAIEPFMRAGTLTCVLPLWPEHVVERLERVEGLGEPLLARADIRDGEVLVVISQSGVNPLPIDIALAGRARGAFLVGIGSTAHTETVQPAHSSGQRLRDVVDVFLDNGMPAGDAILTLPGLPGPCGPGSTVATTALVQAVMVEAAARLAAEGREVPLRISRNLPGGLEHNRRFAEIYGDRIPELRI